MAKVTYTQKPKKIKNEEKKKKKWRNENNNVHCIDYLVSYKEKKNPIILLNPF